MTFAKLPPLFKALTTHKMLPLPRLLTLRHVCAALPLQFIKTAAPAARLDNAPAQNAAPQPRKTTSTHVTKQHKRAICEKIGLEHIILITLCERRPMVRPIATSLRTCCERLRTCCSRSSNAGRTRLQPPDLQS